MLFYSIKAEIETVNTDIDNENKEAYATELQIECNSFNILNKGTSMFISSIKDNRVDAVAVVEPNVNVHDAAAKFLKHLEFSFSSIECEEIEFCTMSKLLECSAEKKYVESYRNMMNDMNVDRLVRYNGSTPNERMIETTRSERELLKASSDMLLEETLKPELERVFAGKKGDVKGHPVHYILNYSSDRLQDEVIDTLLCSLYKSGRIHSKRYFMKTFEDDDSINEKTLDQLFSASTGGAIVITYKREDEDDNPFMVSSRELIDNICSAMKAYRNDVLTIFCVKPDFKGGINAILENTQHVPMVTMKESPVYGAAARGYLQRRARKSGISADASLYSRLRDEGRGYMRFELDEQFDMWLSKKMCTSVYSQYASIFSTEKEAGEKRVNGSAYTQLDRMIGLDSAKKTINQALDFYKAQKLFKDKGMNQSSVAMHMVFTGNPGTAKTTAARHFAQIMKENDLLSNGMLHECGRADLVGKYVGWTADMVKRKFRDARGGVLFIDEAYSLVEDSRAQFGAEAINTIVQEMENNRDDLVVIFAGYPIEMEEFLDTNPGLRSRIAFNIQFDDYSEAELLGILRLMAAEKDMAVDAGAEDKLMEIFRDAVNIENFGNGRYVRNLFERALLNQAGRLVRMDYSDVSREDICNLIADDFESPLLKKQENKRKIGFGVV